MRPSNSISASGPHDHFAVLLLVFQVLMRGANFREGIHAVHYRPQLFAEDEFQHLVQLAHRAHERPQQAPLLAEKESQVDARIVAGGRAARHQSTRGRQRFQALLPGGDADVLDHHVDAALSGELFDFGGNVLLVVIDHVVRAQFVGLGELGGAAGGGDHAALKHLRDLDGRGADAARGCQHQHILARLQPGARHQHVPGSEEDERSGGGGVEVQLVGNRDDAVLGSGDELAVAAVNRIAKHRESAAQIILSAKALLALPAALSWREQHSPARFHALAKLANRDHFTRYVAAEDMRQGELHAGDAGAHEEIQVIQGACANAHQHLVGADLGVGNVFVDEHVGAAVLVNPGCFHIPERYRTRGGAAKLPAPSFDDGRFRTSPSQDGAGGKQLPRGRAQATQAPAALRSKNRELMLAPGMGLPSTWTTCTEINCAPGFAWAPGYPRKTSKPPSASSQGKRVDRLRKVSPPRKAQSGALSGTQPNGLRPRYARYILHSQTVRTAQTFWGDSVSHGRVVCWKFSGGSSK